MNRKSLKQVVVVLTVVSFFMTSVSAFAQSAGRGNDFSILRNVPEEQAVQLSDEEMAKIQGEYLLPLWVMSAVVSWVLKDLVGTYGQNIADYFSYERKNGATVPEAFMAALKNRAHVSDSEAHTLIWSLSRAGLFAVTNVAQ